MNEKEWMKQVEKFKYLGVAFTSDGKQDEELDTQIGKASAVVRALHYSVVVKREFLKKVKLSIFRTVFVSIFTCGHQSLVNDRKNAITRAKRPKWGFLHGIEGVTLFNKMRSSEIKKSFNIEPLLFLVERF